MVETVQGEVKVKAAGGIRDWKTCKAMLDAGAQSKDNWELATEILREKTKA